MINFLEKFRYLAAVLVALSIPAFGCFAGVRVLFCDAGPMSSCIRSAVLILGIPTFQIASLVTGWVFLRKRRHLPISAVLIVLSVIPSFFPIWYVIAMMGSVLI